MRMQTSLDKAVENDQGSGQQNRQVVHVILQAVRPSFVPHGWKLQDKSLAVFILKKAKSENQLVHEITM